MPARFADRRRGTDDLGACRPRTLEEKAVGETEVEAHHWGTMALDERRRMFRLAEWVQPQPFVPVRFRPAEFQPQDIEQRWFPGVHSDVGGGYREDESGLSKIPLIWMIDEAEKAGLRVTESNLDKFAHGAPREEGGTRRHSVH